MKTILDDPLLTFARIGTILVQVGLVIGQVLLGIAIAGFVIGALGLVPEDVVAPEFVAIPRIALWITALTLMLIMVSLGLMSDFVTRLRQIIDSVGQGDPFVGENASRLTRMAWLSLAVQLVMVVAASLAAWVSTQVDRDVFDIKIDVSLSGVLLAIILFILARVFRKGAEMRDELEGTV